MLKPRVIIAIAVAGLSMGATACSDNGGTVHTGTELLPALLSVSDMPTQIASQPVEWNENMRKVIAAPTAPWENTLDPYLCSEAGTPAALTKEQAQLELTGGSVMEILLSDSKSADLYKELKDAYGKCTGTTTPAYTALTGATEVGDESASYKSTQGVVTIARFGKDIMILKWWVGSFYDQAASYYPGIVTKAADKVEAL